MTISYNWLHDYLPVTLQPEELSKILTSIGLEVEGFEPYDSHKGNLEGLVVGEVLECIQHPNADKLKITSVSVGDKEALQIVCGASNVGKGQKVVVARVGTTIYPLNQPPLKIRLAKIRGVESQGMICAEDEIGISELHEGIIVLPEGLEAGIAVTDHYKPYSDWIYEIGLTPNRMDAMSHLGVARDVCSYLQHHHGKPYPIKSPYKESLPVDDNRLAIAVSVDNTHSCQRYSGISITGVTVQESPLWMQQKLRAIGQRPINNIVDITNFILHETGQPLHAFDADKISGNKIWVKNLPDQTRFRTLDDKERILSSHDLMICDGEGNGMCIAGVFGGINSGVKPETRNIFLESAWFNPVDIRKTSFRHGLRTDAATRFEKNVDISNTVNVLKRAAAMIRDIAGGRLSSEIVDVFPGRKEKVEVTLKQAYLKKLSGKDYDLETVSRILEALGFEIREKTNGQLTVAVPYSKPDITLPADIVEEIMRIDGYDNIEIPSSITITPAVETEGYKHAFHEKVAHYLVGQGFNEIFTNSITNAAYFDEPDLQKGVRLLNNLSAVHNIMRPAMLETGLEAIAYNLNRRNSDLQFFEFGKTYHTSGEGNYKETDHLCLHVTGDTREDSWKNKQQSADIYYLKGVVQNVLQLLVARRNSWRISTDNKLDHVLEIYLDDMMVGLAGTVKKHELSRFDIRQPVFFASLNWNLLESLVSGHQIRLQELPRQLSVYRDLAIIVPQKMPYASVENSIQKLGLNKLKEIKLFDIFESDKLGADKKSLAINVTFLDEEKTLTDIEIDHMMNAVMKALEQDLQAEIRK